MNALARMAATASPELHAGGPPCRRDPDPYVGGAPGSDAWALPNVFGTVAPAARQRLPFPGSHFS